MTVEPGEPAPRFQAQVTDGQDIRSFDLEDALDEEAPVVLAFFPFAFTSVCREQLLDLKENLGALQDQGALVFGISVDSPYALRAYHRKHGFGYPLISDFNREAIEAYGLVDERLLGLDRPAKRASVVIAHDGTIAWAWVTQDPEKKPRIEKILEAVEAHTGEDPIPP